ncbi:hypothetical protein [Mycobacterium sp.]|uniref:hypothetical protein n=1 Tax=Mycobacterium sp. TaxID=1785 RepID=UPI002C369981|nr:hypothetical protein [Mycobacterium sp.]HME48781.1 hypothetical protein [Mycobacterium sp.]
MTIIRGITAAVIAVGIAVASANPASASDPMQGIYTYTQAGVDPSTWTIFPTCVAAGCVLHVGGETPHKGPESDEPPYAGDARLVNGIWTMPVNKIDGFTCADGSKAPSTDIYSFDDVTLTGTHTVTHAAVCGTQPGLTKAPFTLAFQAPIPFPVNQDPLICDFAKQCF